MKINYQDLTVRKIGYDDLDEIMDVQEETFAHLTNDDILRRNTRETFAVCFEAPSLALGVFLEGKMIAFGMLYCAGDNEENLAKSLDEEIDLFTVANVKVFIVRPAYRGNGLQKYLMNLLETHAKEQGYTVVMATVAPSNNYSFDNFTQSGYKHVKTLCKYGGLQRALLMKTL